MDINATDLITIYKLLFCVRGGDKKKIASVVLGDFFGCTNEESSCTRFVCYNYFPSIDDVLNDKETKKIEAEIKLEKYLEEHNIDIGDSRYETAKKAVLSWVNVIDGVDRIEIEKKLQEDRLVEVLIELSIVVFEIVARTDNNQIKREALIDKNGTIVIDKLRIIEKKQSDKTVYPEIILENAKRIAKEYNERNFDTGSFFNEDMLPLLMEI